MHLAWRWFTGLGFDQEIPHHSTFSKNRHGRFQESKLFEQLFEQIVKQCVEVDALQKGIVIADITVLKMTISGERGSQDLQTSCNQFTQRQTRKPNQIATPWRDSDTTSGAGKPRSSLAHPPPRITR